MTPEPKAQVLGQGPQVSGITIEEVVGMLMQGISPEDLVQQGVPVDMIKQAITYIMQQEGVAEQQTQTVDQPIQTPIANTLG